MSFIKRSDGITVNEGGHVGSRGSLSSIKHSGGENYDISKEDLRWEKIVLASSVSMDSPSYFGDVDNYLDAGDLSSSLWGIYIQKPDHIKSEFEGCFTPYDH